MKKIVSLVLALALLMSAALTLASCTDKEIYIGVQVGTTSEYFINGNDDFKGLDGYSAKTYQNFGLAVTDMKNGVVPYVIVDNSTGEELVGKINGVKIIDIPLASEEYGIGVDKDQPELLASINEIIAELKSTGKLDEILAMENFTEVASATFDAAKADKQLVVATNAAFAPFESKSGDKFVGIDIEIAKIIADELELELVIQDMDFEAVVTSVGKNNVDIAMSGLTINNERKQSVNFSTPYFCDSYLVLVVPEANTEFKDCKTSDDVLAVLAKNAK